MNLYRLDYVDVDGQHTRAVADWRGPYLSRSYAAAAFRAAAESVETRTPVAITRISGAGSLKTTAVATNGHITRVKATR